MKRRKTPSARNAWLILPLLLVALTLGACYETSYDKADCRLEREAAGRNATATAATSTAASAVRLRAKFLRNSGSCLHAELCNVRLSRRSESGGKPEPRSEQQLHDAGRCCELTAIRHPTCCSEQSERQLPDSEAGRQCRRLKCRQMVLSTRPTSTRFGNGSVPAPLMTRRKQVVPIRVSVAVRNAWRYADVPRQRRLSRALIANPMPRRLTRTRSFLRTATTLRLPRHRYPCRVPIRKAQYSVLSGTTLADGTYRVRLLGSGASFIMDMDANALDGEYHRRVSVGK